MSKGTLIKPISKALSSARPDPSARRIGSEPVRSRCRTDVATGATRTLEHRTAREHAERFIAWLQDNDLAGGMIFHEAILELYTEMVIELGWAERSWNPVARELDLICTGGRKPYEWIVTPHGPETPPACVPHPAA